MKKTKMDDTAAKLSASDKRTVTNALKTISMLATNANEFNKRNGHSPQFVCETVALIANMIREIGTVYKRITKEEK